MMPDPMLELARNIAIFAHETQTKPGDSVALSFCIATVNGYANGKIQVQKPFDSTVLELRYVPSAANLAIGSNAFVLICGSMSNAIVVGDARLQNFQPGGAGGDLRILGQTPLKLTANTDSITMIGAGEVSYEIFSDTLADFDPLTGTLINVTAAQTDGVYEITAKSSAANWYNAYVQATVTGLTVGESYNFVFDGTGVLSNETTHQTVGHYILYDSNGNTLVTRGALDGASLNVYPFTATTTSVYVRWYSATNSTFVSGVSVARCNAIYINAAGTTDHTEIFKISGTFTDQASVLDVPKGVTISSTPSCTVYYEPQTQTTLPLEGKTVVCFGDSLFGMYRGETSAPAWVGYVTGATVYNVGFGGCRWANHPSHGYAEFSMWALADAVATGDWSTQDQYASSGSDYFPEQLALLKSIDFSTVDYVVIHYGTNDFGGNVAIGSDSPDTDHSTICGAMRYSIKALLTAYPHLRIFISLPVFRFWSSGGVTTYSDTYTNSLGNTLPQVISAMESVSEEYNLPYVDGYYKLGINKLNAQSYLTDGTHQNTVGRERFGSYIGARLISER